MTQRRTIRLVTIVGLLLLVIAGSGIAGAFTISAHANTTQLGIIKEIYGTKMTQGEYWEKVYPDELAEIRKNVPEKEFAEFYNQMYYWGDDHPELPNGATVWDENGPVNLRAISSEEKKAFGLEDMKTDESGYVLRGMTSADTASTLDKLCAWVAKRTSMSPKSGLVLNPYDLASSGSAITHGGKGIVGGGSSSTTLSLTTGLYGDGSLVDSYSLYWGSGGNSWKYISHTFYSPQRNVLYQSKLSGSSTNPAHSGYAWSYGELWPF